MLEMGFKFVFLKTNYSKLETTLKDINITTILCQTCVLLETFAILLSNASEQYVKLKNEELSLILDTF
jgi:hypothetical protein